MYQQHIKLTNMFERSMQAVNPSVSLPFWDYSQEAEAEVSIFDSPIFQPNTFGTLSRPHDGVRYARIKYFIVTSLVGFTERGA
jgi:hypothetical protein